MSMNRIVLAGRLTRDPELRYTTSGIAVASLCIAVDRTTKNENGEYDTDFFDITAWRQTAEFAQKYLGKGRLIGVDGRLQNRSWVDQVTGQKRTKAEIVADSLQGLDKRPEGDAGHAPSTAEQVVTTPSIETDLDDEADPFAE